MADYEELFVKELGLTAKIDNKKIVFTNESTELVLTLGSKTVKLNGKSQTMSVAPVKLEFKDGTIKYYVPTRFVAETFGYNYVYNSKTSEAKITETDIVAKVMPTARASILVAIAKMKRV